MNAEEALIEQLEPWIHEDGPRQKAQYAHLAKRLFPNAYVDLRAKVKLAETIGAVFSDEEVLGLIDAIGDHWSRQLERMRASVTDWAPGAWREPAQPEPEERGTAEVLSAESFVLRRGPAAVRLLDPYTGTVLAEFSTLAEAEVAAAGHMRLDVPSPVLPDAVLLSARESIEARAEVYEDFVEDIRREQEEADRLLKAAGGAGIFEKVAEDIRREKDKVIETMARAARDLESAAAAHNLAQLREIVELGGVDLASYTGRQDGPT